MKQVNLDGAVLNRHERKFILSQESSVGAGSGLQTVWIFLPAMCRNRLTGFVVPVPVRAHPGVRSAPAGVQAIISD